MRNLILTAAVLAAATPAAAEELTLERIFDSPSLEGSVPRLPRLSPDGELVTLLRNRADDRDRYDLWAIDASTGQARMLVDSLKIGTGAEVSEEEKMRRERARIAGTKGIVAYQWSPNGETILVPLDGDLYLASLDGNVRRLTETEATELDAQVSETGRYLSFVRENNLYVMDVATGKERALTTDGKGPVSWGAAEFVALEEMGRDKGHWWSPDDRHIALARVDESGVEVVTRAAIGADGTRLYEQRYPVAGSANAVVDLYIMAPDGSGRVKVDLGPNADIYVARVSWMPDGSALLVQRQSRDQKQIDLLRVDPDTGRSSVLFTESSDTWAALDDDLKVLKDGSLIWSSNRSGFNHLYRWKDGKWTPLTQGQWAVAELDGVDEEKGRVYFTGNADTPLEQHLYRVDLDNPGKPVRLTESGWWNNIEMDDEASHALVFRSSAEQPPQVYLAGADGKRLAWVEQNALNASHPYAPYLESHVLPTFGTVKAADGSDLYYEMLSPPREPGRRYPVFVQVYGGPTGRQATRGWTSPLHQYLVDQGWIVFSIDNRGTPDRGKAFADALYLKLGSVEVQDQLAGVEWLKQQPFVDPGKIAVYGWSYGGYMVVKLLEASDAFASGIAGAPVTRWELYDTHYTERYLGNPSIDPAPYQAASALPETGDIVDPLLLIHGMADDNVVFENSTALIAKLQQEGQPFSMMVYPGATHAVTGEGRKTHVWKTIERFLDRTVKAAP